MTTIGLSALAKAVLLPPNLLFILMILRAFVSPRYARFGRALAITAFALLVVFSAPVTGSLLMRQLIDIEPFYPGVSTRQTVQILTDQGWGQGLFEVPLRSMTWSSCSIFVLRLASTFTAACKSVRRERTAIIRRSWPHRGHKL